MKRRNADCGKIRRPIKKNKIAEQIGSNTLLYIKFLLLWAFVIIADFLLEFRFEFLWPFWLLLRSIYDSFKYKGLAFSVLFVCIAVTSDLVCLFFIPVQWLFFAASTYVWVQYVWHTDKGICLPTIILWILFVYLEAAIRWKDSRNIPHLNLCRPFAAHCIGYPVVTLGFGFKSYVGYRIRQRKQREVAKDNDFYMQLLQEALPKEESTALLEPALDGASGTDVLAQKELVLVATANNSLNNSSSSTASSKSDTGQHHHHHHNHHHNHHNHHHHNHQQQQQQQSHSKGAQSYKSSSNSTPSGTHVNGHVSSGSSPSSSGSAMNGGLTHASHQQQGSSKHRKSLDKDSNGSNSTAGSSSTLNAGSKMNGSGGGGSYSYHQATTFQQSSGSNATTASNGSSSSGSNSSNGGVTHSTKENTATVNRANDHSGAGGSIHCNGGSMVKDKDSKENIVPGLVGRKDYDKESSSSSLAGSTSSSSTSSSTRNGQTATVTTNRSKSPTENATGGSSGGTVVGKTTADKQNLSFSDYQQLWVVRQMSTDAPVPAESKGGRSGRKNRLKKAAEQANLSAITKLCATLALASSVTTLTTTGTATSATSGDGGAAVTTSSSSNAGCITSTSANDNHHQHNGEQQEHVASKANVSDNNTVERSANSCNGQGNGTATHHSSGAAESKSATGVSPVSGTLKATQTVNSSGQGSNPAIAPTPVATVVVQKVCESCPRLEGELKKIRSELASHRQMENDMRQKYDATTSNLKGCLQAKQKDFDDLQSRYQEHTNQRQQERQNLQTVERRLGEERRHRQSLEAQLNNERKYRKQAEDKAARSECGESCKMKKQQMEMEIDKLQHELLNMEEAKLMTETQARNIEQEMRKMELQLRSRESQQNTEVLMSALAAMQDKNATLEKNLSAETRVKLDLFSALGGTRREVEILTCSLRTKEKEILDLNAKIVQLVAVMPTMPNDALCLTGHTSGSGVDGVSGGSMMRLPDAPQLLPQPMSSGHLNGVLPGGGPSGGGGGMQQSGQQSSSLSHMVQNGPPFCSQLGSLGVLTSTMTTLSSSSVMSGPNAGSANNCGVVGLSSLSGSGGGGVSVSGGGQIVQMQNSNNGSNGNCPSNLDPNATIYTPKNNGMVGGTEA